MLLYALARDVIVYAAYDPITGVDTCSDGIVCYNHGHCYSDDSSVTSECRCQTGFNGTNCQYSRMAKNIKFDALLKYFLSLILNFNTLGTFFLGIVNINY